MKTEIIECLKSAHTDEMEDISKYEEIFTKLENDGCYRAAGIIRDIIKDEWTHVRALAHIIDMGVQT